MHAGGSLSSRKVNYEYSGMSMGHRYTIWNLADGVVPLVGESLVECNQRNGYFYDSAFEYDCVNSTSILEVCTLL